MSDKLKLEGAKISERVTALEVENGRLNERLLERDTEVQALQLTIETLKKNIVDPDAAKRHKKRKSSELYNTFGVVFGVSTA